MIILKLNEAMVCNSKKNGKDSDMKMVQIK